MPQPVRKFSVVKDYVSGEQFLGLYIGIGLTKTQANAIQHYLETEHYSAARTLLQSICWNQGLEISAVAELMFSHLEDEQLMRQVRSNKRAKHPEKDDGNVVIIGSGNDTKE